MTSLLEKLNDSPVDTKKNSILHDNIRHDLESLLNTRRCFLSFPETLTALKTSLINYGIPDFMGSELDSESAQNDFCEILSHIIQRYEPRFKDVSITLQKKDPQKPNRVLRLRIEGILLAEPFPESIVLNSILEPETRYFNIVEHY